MLAVAGAEPERGTPGSAATLGGAVDDLVQFLRARLDEDEALAREAPAGPWHIGNAVDPTQPCSVHMFPSVRLVADGLNWLVAEHIARHNPARVLDEVAAKREIVSDYEYAALTLSAASPNTPPYDLMTGATNTLKRMLRVLARAYRKHPEFDPAWLEG
jgi:Family of unknown function (DUF6221)